MQNEQLDVYTTAKPSWSEVRKMPLWRRLRFVLQFMLTAATPIFLFCGIACFSANEIYVWYLMHSKSLIAAFASFLCILLLYLLAVPIVFSVSMKSKLISAFLQIEGEFEVVVPSTASTEVAKHYQVRNPLS